jgi:hypothetical protein
MEIDELMITSMAAGTKTEVMWRSEEITPGGYCRRMRKEGEVRMDTGKRRRRTNCEDSKVDH